MLKAVAKLETDRPVRYMQAMCKHFAHKISVECGDRESFAHLPDGVLSMTAADERTLVFEVTAENLQKLLKTRYVVDAHIVRFAFREKLFGLDWTTQD